MLINVPMVDWVRLTTFSPEVYAYFNEAVMSEEIKGVRIDGKTWRQYTGFEYPTQGGNVFLGSAIQQSKPHYMLQVTSEYAHHFFVDYLGGMAKCTRVDLQITVPLWPSYRARVFKDLIESGNAGRKNSPTIHMREGETALGMDTVYYGSRNSEVYQRWYVKQDIDENKFLRFECEFTGSQAQQVWKLLADEPNAASGILLSQLHRLPDVARRYNGILDIASFLEKFDPLRVGTVVDNSGTIKWFNTILIPYLVKSLYDKQVRGYVRHTLDEMLVETTKYSTLKEFTENRMEALVDKLDE